MYCVCVVVFLTTSARSANSRLTISTAKVLIIFQSAKYFANIFYCCWLFCRLSCSELNIFCQIMYAAAPNPLYGKRYVWAIQTPNDVFFCPNAWPAEIRIEWSLSYILYPSHLPRKNCSRHTTNAAAAKITKVDIGYSPQTSVFVMSPVKITIVADHK